MDKLLRISISNVVFVILYKISFYLRVLIYNTIIISALNVDIFN